MPIYSVSYDLRQPGQSYDRLTEARRSFSHCHAQGSLWFVEAAGPAAALRDALMPLVDRNDVLFIDEVGSAWAGCNMGHCAQWLNDRGR